MRCRIQMWAGIKQVAGDLLWREAQMEYDGIGISDFYPNDRKWLNPNMRVARARR